MHGCEYSAVAPGDTVTMRVVSEEVKSPVPKYAVNTACVGHWAGHPRRLGGCGTAAAGRNTVGAGMIV
jgi:hypothetical protein